MAARHDWRVHDLPERLTLGAGDGEPNRLLLADALALCATLADGARRPGLRRSAVRHRPGAAGGGRRGRRAPLRRPARRPGAVPGLARAASRGVPPRARPDRLALPAPRPPHERARAHRARRHLRARVPSATRSSGATAWAGARRPTRSRASTTCCCSTRAGRATRSTGCAAGSRRRWRPSTPTPTSTAATSARTASATTSRAASRSTRCGTSRASRRPRASAWATRRRSRSPCSSASWEPPRTPARSWSTPSSAAARRRWPRSASAAGSSCGDSSPRGDRGHLRPPRARGARAAGAGCAPFAPLILAPPFSTILAGKRAPGGEPPSARTRAVTRQESACTSTAARSSSRSRTSWTNRNPAWPG